MKNGSRVEREDVLTQRRRDAEYAERYEPRNTLNTRNAKTTQGLRPTRLRRSEEEVTKLQTTDCTQCAVEELESGVGKRCDEMFLILLGIANG